MPLLDSKARICYNEAHAGLLEGIRMKKPLSALIWTIAAGVIGIYVGALFLNLEGYLGNVFAIAAAAYFIVSAIEEKESHE